MPDCILNLTISTVESWGPCVAWTRERLEEIAAGRSEVPLLEILRRGDISVPDRVWVGCHALPEIRWWCADRAVRLHAPKALDEAGLHENAARLRDLPKIVDVETVRASWAVVRDSALDATWAAMDALIALDAARGSLAATCGADNDAAWDAALAAAVSGAEQQTQLDRLIMLAEEKSC